VAKEYNWKYRPEARPAFLQLELIGKLKGLDAMLAKYDGLKNLSGSKNRPEEHILNGIGYDYLRAGRTEDAVRIFQKNVVEFPESSNVYDSLGEAYATAGKKDLAIENYERSVKLDPKNQIGIDRLKKLKGSQ
jgi:tetratricopeptide (TPR) repeat protein